MKPSCLALLCAIALLASTACALAEPLSAEKLESDARLEKRVTLSSGRIFVGELLERLSAETGVRLTAGEAGDSAADDRVCVVLQRTRLIDAMNALWSLLSYRGGEWHWSRTGEPGSYRYTLLRPVKAQSLGGRLLRQLHEDFETHANDLLKAATASPEERAAAGKRDPVLGALLASGRLRSGMSVFGETLSPEQQSTVLQGRGSIRVPTQALSPEGREFVRSVWSASQTVRITADGRREPAPEPGWIEFRAQRLGDNITPSLFIQMEGIGGYGYAGGNPFEKKWQEMQSEQWMLPGDSAKAPADSSKRGSEGEKRAPAVERRALEQRLVELGEERTLALMALLPLEQRDPGPVGDRPLAAYLAHLKEQPPHLMHKWRHGVLLLRYPAWFVSEAPEARVAWKSVKALRKAHSQGKGAFSLADLAEAAATLNELQLWSIHDEFPVMRSLATWRPVLMLYHHPVYRAQLGSPTGLALNQVPPELRPLLGQRLRTLGADDTVTAIRVEADSPEPGADVRIDFLRSDNTWRTAGKLVQRTPMREPSP